MMSISGRTRRLAALTRGTPLAPILLILILGCMVGYVTAGDRSEHVCGYEDVAVTPSVQREVIQVPCVIVVQRPCTFFEDLFNKDCTEETWGLCNETRTFLSPGSGSSVPICCEGWTTDSRGNCLVPVMVSTAVAPTEIPISDGNTESGLVLTGDDEGPLNIALIVLVTAACLVVLLCVAIGYTLFSRRRKRQQQQHLRLDELYLSNPPNTYLTPEGCHGDPEHHQIRQLGVENLDGDTAADIMARSGNPHALMMSHPDILAGCPPRPRWLGSHPGSRRHLEGGDSGNPTHSSAPGATADPGTSDPGRPQNDNDGVYEFIAGPKQMELWNDSVFPNNNYVNTSPSSLTKKSLSSSHGLLWSKGNDGLLYINMPHSRKGSVDLICDKPSAVCMRDYGMDNTDLNQNRSCGSSTNSLSKLVTRPSVTKEPDVSWGDPGNELYLDMSKSSVDIRDVSDAGYSSVSHSTPILSRQSTDEGQAYLDMTSSRRDVREPDNGEYTYIPSDGKTAVRQSECTYIPPECLRESDQLFEPEYSSIPSPIESECDKKTYDMDPEYASIPESSRPPPFIQDAVYENMNGSPPRISSIDHGKGGGTGLTNDADGIYDVAAQVSLDEPMYESIPSRNEEYTPPNDDNFDTTSTPSTPLESGYERALDVRPESVSDTSNYYEDVAPYRRKPSSLAERPRSCSFSSQSEGDSSARGSLSGHEREQSPRIRSPGTVETARPACDRKTIPPVPTKKPKRVHNDTKVKAAKPSSDGKTIPPVPSKKPKGVHNETSRSPRTSNASASANANLKIPPIPSSRKPSPSRAEAPTTGGDIPSIPSRRKPKLSLSSQSHPSDVSGRNATAESIA